MALKPRKVWPTINRFRPSWAVNRILSKAAIYGLAAVIGGCGLLPNLGGDGMTHAEKAVLNMQMGTRYLELGMLEDAKGKLETALDLDSGNGDIHNAMAIFYEQIKEYPEAEQYYESALRRKSDSFDIKNNYGRFLCERGNYAKGIAMLQEALAEPMNNRQWHALTSLGLCYVKQNDLQRGEEYLRQALQLQGDYPPALLEMQKLSYQNRQYMSARAFLERYLAVGNHTPETLWLAFQTERSLGNRSMAEEYRRLLLNSFPASQEAQDIKNAISK